MNLLKLILTSPFTALMAIWTWLDGKKTKIAAGIATFELILVSFNSEVLMGYWGQPGIPHLQPVLQTMTWAAGIFGGTGLVHGYAKSQSTPK